jgi:dihydrodipicolinate synthase/N-acetylneuraminate lyase
MAAKMEQLPTGLICPLVTPLKTGDVVDVSVLDRLIDHVGTGADALLLSDVFWGEGLVLSSEMRLEMSCAVLEIIQGKWPVLINITSHNRKATRDLMARTEAFIERLDYPGRVYWVDYDAGLVERRKWPVKHKNIRTSVLKRISQIEKVGGLVFCGSLKRSMNYRKAVRNRQGFKLYDGDELSFLRQPSSNGVMAGGANLLPEAWRGITNSCLNRYDVQQQYPDHTSQILETAAMLEEFHETYAQNPAAIMKRMLHVAGVLPNAHTASATEPSTADQNRAVEAICKKYDLIS